MERNLELEKAFLQFLDKYLTLSNTDNNFLLEKHMGWDFYITFINNVSCVTIYKSGKNEIYFSILTMHNGNTVEKGHCDFIRDKIIGLHFMQKMGAL